MKTFPSKPNNYKYSVEDNSNKVTCLPNIYRQTLGNQHKNIKPPEKYHFKNVVIN